VSGRKPPEIADHLGPLLVALFAPLGLVFIGSLNVARRHFTLQLGWVALWLGSAVLLFPLAFVRPAALTFLLPLLGLGLLASLLLQTRRSLVPGFLSALALLVAAGLLDLGLSATTWLAYDMRSNLPKLLEPARETVTVPSTRRWTLPEGVPVIRVQFEARHAGSLRSWNWHRSVQSFVLEPRSEEGHTYVRVHTPTGGDPWLMRSYDTGKSTGGETFRARVTLRATDMPTQARPSLGLQTQSSEGLLRHTLPVALTEEWQTFSFEWTLPATADTPYLHLTLNNFGGLSYDLRDAVLERYHEGTWERLEAPAPTGVSLRFDWPGKPPELATHLRFQPDDTWRTYHLDIATPDLVETVLEGTLVPEEGTAVTIRNFTLTSYTPADSTSLVSSDPVAIRPRWRLHRLQLWFGQPNLLGHSAAVAGLVIIALARSPWVAVVGLALSAATVGLSGSRAALIALFGATLLLAVSLERALGWSRPRVMGLMVGSAVLLIALSTVGLSRLQAPEVITSRPEIWQVAWQGFLEYPLSGVGYNFVSYWQKTYLGSSSEHVAHAHNLWLAFASSYGLPGLAAILWLTGGLLLLAWYWGRWRGLILSLPILVMNFLDYTLFYSGVLYPLLLGLNALRTRADAQALDGPPGSGDNVARAR
jgi:hypothetical protein